MYSGTSGNDTLERERQRRKIQERLINTGNQCCEIQETAGKIRRQHKGKLDGILRQSTADVIGRNVENWRHILVGAYIGKMKIEGEKA